MENEIKESSKWIDKITRKEVVVYEVLKSGGIIRLTDLNYNIVYTKEEWLRAYEPLTIENNIKIGSKWQGIYTKQLIEITNILDGEAECTYDDGDVLMCELDKFKGEYIPYEAPKELKILLNSDGEILPEIINKIIEGVNKASSRNCTISNIDLENFIIRKVKENDR